MSQMIKIPFLLVPPKAIESHSRLMAIGRASRKITPNLKNNLQALYYTISPESYFMACLLSSLAYIFVFCILVFSVLLVFTMDAPMDDTFTKSLALGFIFGFMFFMLLLMYPSILVKKISAKKNKNVLFALREVVLSVESGITLFDSMKNVSTVADYGFVADDFRRVVKKIESGYSEKEALQEIAITNQNEYMKRAAWQIINSIETGSQVGPTLGTVIDALEKQIYREIRIYSSNLNFIMLVYLLGAAALPSIGIAFLVLLSLFGGLGVDTSTIGLLVGTSVVFQIVVIGYVNSTRPDLFGG
ncbi:MAG: type II secretion system F family protein [Candidatus Micrarchaeota archaeon]